MKQLDTNIAKLDVVLDRLDLTFGKGIKEKLLMHLDLVIEKNKTLNLTRVDSLEEALILHIEDSLSVYKEFSQVPGNYIDIGTGAGFPGIPLGIATGKSGVLLDSVKKKAKAVDEFLDQLDLKPQLSTCGLRSEELAQERSESFDLVIARAVSSLPAVEELATPLLKQGGTLIAMRAIDEPQVLRKAEEAGKLLGLKLIVRRAFEIGEGKYSRSVCVFKKIGKSKLKLPRHPGYASKRPLV